MTYGYDDLNRLSTASATAYTRTYTYDEWANLRTVTATGAGETGTYTLGYAPNASGAPATNRINQYNGGAVYDYDSAGNLKVADGWTYTYDAASRMKTAGGTNYGFDGDGRRVRVQQGGYSSIYYLWSSVLGQPVAEIVGDTGAIFQAYVYSASGQMLALLSNDGGFYWSHQDHLGSGRKLTDSTGAVRYRGEFDPHGQTLLEVTAGGTGTYANSHKYTGYEREWSTNLNYAQARMYSHNRARFMQPDPLGIGASDLASPQTLNRYSYVANDPVNFVDPSGLLAMFCETRTYETCIAGDCSRETITTCTVFADGPSGGGGGGIGQTGGGGQSGGQTQQPPQNDCHRFADMVARIAGEASGRDDFFDRLARTFTAANDSSISEMRRAANLALPAGRPRFGASGFKEQFRDPSNQVRHFVGGLIAGFRLGHLPALVFMNSRETEGADDADIALNGESTWMGHNYGAAPGSKASDAYGGYRALADAIRRRICD